MARSKVLTFNVYLDGSVDVVLRAAFYEFHLCEANPQWFYPLRDLIELESKKYLGGKLNAKNSD